MVLLNNYKRFHYIHRLFSLPINNYNVAAIAKNCKKLTYFIVKKVFFGVIFIKKISLTCTKLKWTIGIDASFIWILRETVSPAIQENIFTLIYVKLVLNEIYTRSLPLYTETSLLWWRASNFDLYLVLMVIEEWRFLCVRLLLWHGTSLW